MRHSLLWTLIVLMAVPILLLGCVTEQSLLAPYAELPESCAAIEAEMRSVAHSDAPRANLNAATSGVSAGLGVAAAAGVLPAGWAWAPLGAVLIGQLRLGTHDQRLAYLAYQRAYRSCQSSIIFAEGK